MEPPTSSRCPLRGLSSQALGCKRSFFFLWLGYLLSSSFWKACVRAACPHGLPRPQPRSPPGRVSTFQMNFLLGAPRDAGAFGPGGANTCVPKSGTAPSPSRTTPLSCVCRGSRIYSLERAVRRRREGGRPWPNSSDLSEGPGGMKWPSARGT